MDGFLLINKEKGMTSFDVVSQVKKKLNIRKVGHSGTLDPQTEGLLVLALGKGTKFLEDITRNSKKEYIATMKFGILTNTYDIYGDVIKEDNYKIDLTKEETVEKVFKNYIGSYRQVPPTFSAKKINGKRAYEYGFENKEIDMTKSSKDVTIYELDIINTDEKSNEISFRTVVSKGTYVRSLIHDIAKDLNTYATMTYLKREATDGFVLEDSCKINDNIDSKIISLNDYIKKRYSGVLEIDGKLLELIKNGSKFDNREIVKKFDEKAINNEILFIDKQSNNIAIYQKQNESYLVKTML